MIEPAQTTQGSSGQGALSASQFGQQPQNLLGLLRAAQVSQGLDRLFAQDVFRVIGDLQKQVEGSRIAQLAQGGHRPLPQWQGRL